MIIAFQSTRPLRGATTAGTMRSSTTSYFNPRAPCGARRSDCVIYQRFANISIHAPLAGRDQELIHRAVCLYISIHAPLAGRDTVRPLLTIHTQYFNPRAPCGARPSVPAKSFLPFVISIHAPLAGRDCLASTEFNVHDLFQSTRPLRGATSASMPSLSSRAVFQSTRPLRGATFSGSASSRKALISIHAPLAGRDTRGRAAREQPHRFQSTRPLRGATAVLRVPYAFAGFQSTRPLRGATIPTHEAARQTSDFNPRAPCGARPLCVRCSRQCTRHFNPRAPCGARQGLDLLGPLDVNFNPRAPCGARRPCREWSLFLF